MASATLPAKGVACKTRHGDIAQFTNGLGTKPSLYSCVCSKQLCVTRCLPFSVGRRVQGSCECLSPS